MEFIKSTFGIWMICCLLLPWQRSSGQRVVSTNKGETLLSQTHSERVYLHHNKALLLAGEHLYYKMYVLKHNPKALSTFSKIGYVELVGEDGERIFRHKIRLEKGVGQGEFFVPVTVPSGNYKLIGYTQWMKNYGLDHFFKSDIGLINPFQNDQTAITQEVNDSVQPATKKLELAPLEPVAEPNERFTFGLDKKILKTREQGMLSIKTTQKHGIGGSFSVSVRKIDSIDEPPIFSAQSYVEKQVGQNLKVKSRPQDSIQLPELRGELLSGKIIPKDVNFLLGEEEVALSIPGEHFVLKLTRTNTQGEFYFNLNHEYMNDRAFVQVLGKNRDKYQIQLNKQPTLDYGNLKFNKLLVTPAMKNFILTRSVHNQVENAYVELRKDSTMPIEQTLPIYKRYSRTYDLDDYTRFSTVRETTSEVLEHVWVHNGKDGAETLKVRGVEDEMATGHLPLLLVDGLLVQQHTDIMDYDAKRIKKVNLSREDCVINSITFNGIIAMETVAGNFYQEISRDYVRAVELFPPLPKKKYFTQTYGTATISDQGQIPDFREQLLWLPHLVVGKGVNQVEFYTSDVAGQYGVYVEGFTDNGDPVSWRETFEVVP